MSIKNYGGQAVIEGVMIRGPEGFNIAVRGPNGDIVTRREDRVPWTKRWPFLGWPFVRGPVALAETVSLGVHALLYSANAALGEDEEVSTRDMVLAVLVAVALAVGLFMVAPTLVASFLRQFFPARTLWLNVAEGLIRVAFVVGYIVTISRMKDIQRVLEYHGAEHKVINALEDGGSMDVTTAAKYPRLHPRCGTSFLLLVAVVSIFLFSFFGWPGVIQRILLRIAMLPVVSGVAYEIIKLSGRIRPGSPLRWVLAPGMWLQSLTTREPDTGQVEVALAALSGLMEEHQGGGIDG
ncbi:MAG: DUF1385 domain-containing protein [Bacillota bacterium]